MFKCLVVCICFIAVSTHFAFAQDQNEGWPTVQRCVPEPALPPDDWAYPGVILATGWAGLHGIRADLHTPYVLAFVKDRYWDGVLSPNGKWYALDRGEYIDGPLFADSINIYQLEIYSTLNRDTVYIIPWENHIGGISDARTTNHVYWLDNEHLVYRNNEIGDVIFNPFMGTIESLRGRLILPYEGYIFHPSPDWTRAVFNTYRLSPDWQLNDLDTGKELLSLITDPNSVADWSHDSSKFILQIEDLKPESNVSLVILDRDGEHVDTIFVSEETSPGAKFAYWSHGWSPDDRYFAFVPLFYGDAFAYDSLLYIADTLAQQIIDTCLNIKTGARGGIAWSPDGTMLAFAVNSPANDPIRILDLNGWQSYTVAYHDGSIIGWRKGN